MWHHTLQSSHSSPSSTNASTRLQLAPDQARGPRVIPVQTPKGCMHGVGHETRRRQLDPNFLPPQTSTRRHSKSCMAESRVPRYTSLLPTCGGCPMLPRKLERRGLSKDRILIKWASTTFGRCWKLVGGLLETGGRGEWGRGGTADRPSAESRSLKPILSILTSRRHASLQPTTSHAAQCHLMEPPHKSAPASLVLHVPSPKARL